MMSLSTTRSNLNSTMAAKNKNINTRILLVFLHGAGMNNLVWENVSEQLTRKSFKTLVLDWPGHGNSSDGPLTTIPSLGLWLIARLERSNFDQFALIGHSLGSAVAGYAAAAMGTKVKSLILCSTARNFCVHPDLLKMASENECQAQKLIEKWSAGTKPHHLTDYFTSKLKGTLVIDLKACNEYLKCLSDAKRWLCPTLFISGTKDRMTPLNGASPLVDAARFSSHAGIEGAGHMLPLEVPEQLVNLIEVFLKKSL